MKLFYYISTLPSSVKGLLGLLAVFGTFAGYVVVSVIADPDQTTSEYSIENEIDNTLLPNLEDEVKSAEKPIKVVEIPDSFISESKQPKKNPKKSVKQKSEKTKKPKTKVFKKKPIKDFKPKSTKKTAFTDQLSNRVDPSVILANRRNQINVKSLAFSKVSYASLTESSNIDNSSDKNVQDKWSIDKDENTYPTDLSRVVTKEKFITAILNNRVDSTFAGKVLLTIDQNIYATQGNNILIPVGTKASGTYAPVEEIGIERLSMTIERMVTPDGQLILFKIPSTIADTQGATGLSGEVDNKYLQKFGLPLAFSVASNTTNLVFQRLADALSDSDGEDDNSSLSEIFDEQWSKDQSATNNDIISEIIENNINVMPTITIEPGQKMILYLEHDIWFKPNRNGVTEVVKAD